MTPPPLEHGLFRLLPHALRVRLAARVELRQVLVNIQWLLLQVVFEAVLGLVVGIWVARYLGPERFGTLNYTLAFVALGTPLATVGLGSLVVRNLVRDEHDAHAILGTATFLRGIASVFLVLVSVIAISLLRPGNDELRNYVAIIAVAYGVRNLGVVEFWFQAKVQAKYLTLARVCAAIPGNALRLWMLMAGASLVMFVVATGVELALPTAALLIMYRFTTGVSPTLWRVRWTTAVEMLSDSWPLIFSGLMAVIYMKIGQVMLGEMRGDADVGMYSAAVRLSEAFFVFPNVVLISVFPSLVRAREMGRDVYLARFQRLYDAFVWMAVGAAITVQFLAGFLVEHLFGAAFSAAAPVLAVHIWAGVFWFPGSAGHRYLILENHTKIMFVMTVAGAATNVLLNIVLIPRMGMLGAAYATLLSFSVSHWCSAIYTSRSRIVVAFWLRAFDPFGLVQRWKPVFARR